MIRIVKADPRPFRAILPCADEAGDGAHIAGRRLPCRAEWPIPRTRPTAVLLIAAIVLIAARSIDRAIEPMERVTAIIVRVDGGCKECQDALRSGLGLTLRADRSLSLHTRVELEKRKSLHTGPRHRRPKRPTPDGFQDLRVYDVLGEPRKIPREDLLFFVPSHHADLGAVGLDARHIGRPPHHRANLHIARVPDGRRHDAI